MPASKEKLNYRPKSQVIKYLHRCTGPDCKAAFSTAGLLFDHILKSHSAMPVAAPKHKHGEHKSHHRRASHERRSNSADVRSPTSTAKPTAVTTTTSHHTPATTSNTTTDVKPIVTAPPARAVSKSAPTITRPTFNTTTTKTVPTTPTIAAPTVKTTPAASTSTSGEGKAATWTPIIPTSRPKVIEPIESDTSDDEVGDVLTLDVCTDIDPPPEEASTTSKPTTHEVDRRIVRRDSTDTDSGTTSNTPTEFVPRKIPRFDLESPVGRRVTSIQESRITTRYTREGLVESHTKVNRVYNVKPQTQGDV